MKEKFKTLEFFRGNRKLKGGINMAKWRITAPKGQHLGSINIPVIDGITRIAMEETDIACVGYTDNVNVVNYLKDSSIHNLIIEEVEE